SLATGFGGILMILIVIYLPVDIYEGGGALIMLGALLTITGPIVALLFYQRARVFDQIISGQDQIVYWQYTSNEWQRFIGDEKIFRANEQRGTQLIVLFFTVMFGAIFWIADPEVGWIVTLVLLGINIPIAGVVWLKQRSIDNWQNSPDLFCRINPRGLILNNQLHVWTGWGARLEKVGTSFGKINLLEITYSAPNRYSRQYYTIRIPILTGKETEAETVVKSLS
ncbi:hypothetical protein KJ855_01155, partial [Patescibacteria group bacterium]|nr:hypothetical protein [Patescibacteria group bacterium]